MNKINLRLNGAGRKGVTHSRPDNVPLFTFPPVDLAGSQKFQEVCRQLWEKGVVSTKTMLQTHGYDMDQERERMKTDPPRENTPQESSSDTSDSGQAKRGRPTLDDSERSSDPMKSQTGRQPKPSNPEGSL